MCALICIYKFMFLAQHGYESVMWLRAVDDFGGTVTKLRCIEFNLFELKVN